MSDCEGIINHCNCCFCHKVAESKNIYNPKYTCECGKIVNLLSAYRHFKTKIHTNFINGIKPKITKYQVIKNRELWLKENAPKSPKYNLDNTSLSLAF